MLKTPSGTPKDALMAPELPTLDLTASAGPGDLGPAGTSRLYPILLAGLLWLSGCEQKAGPVAVSEVRTGQALYMQHCASCHGANLEGQPNWRTRMANGRLPAPPHDETGHTWHHPDDLLFGIVKFGVVPPYAPPNYQSDMPAFKDKLSDAEIHAILNYIKSTWPKDILAEQQEITRNAQ